MERTRLGAGDDLVALPKTVMGNGGLDNGAGPVWEDGSGGGSVSALHEVSGPITLDESGDAVTFREDDAIMARFARDYVELLDARIAAIKTGIDSRNDLTANVSLLSLESASAMVGEKELATIVRLLRSAIERGQRALVPALVTAMSVEALAVRERLYQPT